MPCHPQGGRDLKRENWSLRQKAEEIAFGFFFFFKVLAKGTLFSNIHCSHIFFKCQSLHK